MPKPIRLVSYCTFYQVETFTIFVVLWVLEVPIIIKNSFDLSNIVILSYFYTLNITS